MTSDPDDCYLVLGFARCHKFHLSELNDFTVYVGFLLGSNYVQCCMYPTLVRINITTIEVNLHFDSLQNDIVNPEIGI